jgi:hypothetical protein
MILNRNVYKEVKMNRRTTVCAYLVLVTSILFLVPSVVWAGNKRIMTIRAATAIAERALVETVYGLKVRSTEQVSEMIASSFAGTLESKTKTKIQGITVETVEYDDKSDIAKVTASIQLDSITNIDGAVLNLQNKIFRRVGFATSTPSQAGPLKALRAAELDAYNQLAKSLVGFTLESETSVENFMLKSDEVKTKVLATLYLAKVTEYGWTDNGDAYVKMILDLNEVSAILGEAIVGAGQVIEVEGLGAQKDDFKKTARKK